MSTCPKNDIHSIYLDNELPLSYKKEYEEHIKNCPSCRQKLEKLKKIRNLIQEDKSSIVLTQEDMDKSYERLLSRMSYAKTTSKTRSYRKLNSSFKYIATVAAAAAVVALVLPVRVQKTTSIQNIADIQENSFTPVARTSPLAVRNQNVHLEGNITPKTISSMVGSNQNSEETSDSVFITPYGTPDSASESARRASLSSYDMFMEPIEVTGNQQNTEFVLHISYPFATLSFEIKGMGN